MSSTDIATQSMPIVSRRFASRAISDFVPTPSVEDTSSGSSYCFQSTANSPPKPPMSPTTSRAERRADVRLDELDGLLAGRDVDAGVGVGQRSSSTRESTSRVRSTVPGTCSVRCLRPRARASCRDRGPGTG